MVATEALCTDLRHWHQLYIAGRLQKPVLHVRCTLRLCRPEWRQGRRVVGDCSKYWVGVLCASLKLRMVSSCMLMRLVCKVPDLS